jgi:hypothetical protein
MQREGALYTCTIGGRMGQHGWRHTRVGNGIARCGGRVAWWACARATQRRSGGELDREGAGHGHAPRMGMPAHDAYVRLSSWAVT